LLDEEESEDDDDDDDDEEESTEEPPKMEVDNRQKQKKTEETPKTTVRNIQILIACHLTEHWEFWMCDTCAVFKRKAMHRFCVKSSYNVLI